MLSFFVRNVLILLLYLITLVTLVRILLTIVRLVYFLVSVKYLNLWSTLPLFLIWNLQVVTLFRSSVWLSQIPLHCRPLNSHHWENV